jgi:hypothetical protein
MEAPAHLFSRLSGLRMMPQTATGDGLSFDPFPLDVDGLAPAEVDVGRGKIGGSVEGCRSVADAGEVLQRADER